MLFAAEVVGSSRELTHKRKDIDFLGGPMVKNLPANARDSVLIPGLGRFHMLPKRQSYHRKDMAQK